jgi:ribosomal protein S18 acetylase RimI-like enzyme
MGEILKDFSDSGLVNANEVNRFGFLDYFKKWPRAEVTDTPEILRAITDVPFGIFNHVFRFKLPPEKIDSAIEEIIQQGKDRKVPIWWSLGPVSEPEVTGGHLERLGVVHVSDSPGMGMDLSKLEESVPHPPSFSITPVEDQASLDIHNKVFMTGFEFPDFASEAWNDLVESGGFGEEAGFFLFTGWLEGEPVATSALFLSGGVAGIYNVATLSEARGKGIGTAVTHTAMKEGLQRGYLTCILQSSKLGFNVYKKLGFRETHKLNLYEWKSESEEKDLE